MVYETEIVRARTFSTEKANLRKIPARLNVLFFHWTEVCFYTRSSQDTQKKTDF